MWDRLFMGDSYRFSPTDENFTTGGTFSGYSFWAHYPLVIFPGFLQFFLRRMYVEEPGIQCGQMILATMCLVWIIAVAPGTIDLFGGMQFFCNSFFPLMNLVMYWKGSEDLHASFPYQLSCCVCATKKLCCLCKCRLGGMVSTVKYSSHRDHLLGRAPWANTDELNDTGISLPGLCFDVPSFWQYRREFSHDRKSKIISCSSLTKLIGSVKCNSGERAYFEVKVVDQGSVMRLGWQGGRSKWLLDVVCRQSAEWPQWDMRVQSGDVVGLACDLVAGTVQVSINGDWSAQNMTNDLAKVNIPHLLQVFEYVGLTLIVLSVVMRLISYTSTEQRWKIPYNAAIHGAGGNERQDV